ncbi:hypothetical protein CBS101457_000852 [Exobasidium rhododendri]|nr:hypothetical protein CBS101457_000852 [Exobasidium rhododendri]
MTEAAGSRPPLGYSSLAVSSAQILLPLTISNKCGQSFRWRRVEVYEAVKEEGSMISHGSTGDSNIKKEDSEDDVNAALPFEVTRTDYRKEIEWSICLADRVVFLRQDEERGFLYHKTLVPEGREPEKNSVTMTDETSEWLKDYLNLRVPLTELYEEWSNKDEVFKRFSKRFTGIRMLRQDPWECLCAFICSSNNNIARIGQMVQNLCTHYSEPLLSYTYPMPPKEALDGIEDASQLAPINIVYHPFPSPDRLAQEDVEERLRELSFGYRARYIYETARMLIEKLEERVEGGGSSKLLKYASVDEYLHSLRQMTYGQARSELLQLQGVGPKVADCILLMSMDQPSSIPVDRHVYQFAERWYHIRTKGGLKGYEIIASRFRDLWGPYAGWAHSILFTADLRAFATYKQEEEVKIEVGSVEGELKHSIVKREEEPLVKTEEVKVELTFRDNGRPARTSLKRSQGENGSTLNEPFHGGKRSAAQQSSIFRNGRASRSRD